ncbi:Clavaminate synthase-like protein [Neofusicoccum parvum]|uniref:Clavaminate synthase-like protein n=2 Tax=Neofusicoccum parvum TaxID=310453 RepID=A0ACB5SJH5_9PEZI|nr:putative clavaminate synthase-like protein [Neofusicoccum parvum UCRNP2]GME44261.1 Clavaminate synthase-like protein [Neofusicoccum parvum]GME66104.1 Clavaminate synthase-like protein [Neofusicoccum parvum]
MASAKTSIPKFVPAAPTKEKLDWIELVNVDFAKYDDPNTRKELAQDLLKAVTEHGFLTISNHGISDELYESQMSLAHAVMTLEPEEKLPFEATPEEDASGLYVGFKPSGERGIKGGFHKTLDHYNILVHDPENHSHPKILEPHMDEVRQTMDIIRNSILKKLLVLVAMILDVPEEVVLRTHAFGKESTEYLRYMIYNPRTEEDNQKYRDLYLAGHTDWGTFTFLFSQPISALQILDNHGQWKWVQYLQNALVVNVGEALELMTGGFFKATIHRVVKPPQDQEREKRVGVIYFTRPVNEVPLKPIDSPLLKRLGLDKPLDPVVYNMPDYLNARKHGYKRLDFDNDRPRQQGVHEDPFHGEYHDPQGFKALGKEPVQTSVAV